ncbi:MAG: lysophospholipid acyltransferase family protein [Nitrospiria bacterium]
MKIFGVEHVPNAGGAIVCANHNSYFDIPFLGCALPRPADNIAKTELFRNKIVGYFFRKLGGFPVRRGKADHHAMKEALQRLKSGRLLSIYPEGTRSRDGALQKGKAGIGMLVTASGVRVIPAFIQGTQRVRPFRRVIVCFGKPIDFSELIENASKEGMHTKILYGTIASRVMDEIAILKKQIEKKAFSDKAMNSLGRS